MKPFISLEEAAYLLAGNSATHEEVQSWIDLLVTQADQLQAVQSRRMQSDLPGGLSFNAEPRQWQIPTHIFNTWREAHMPEKAAMQDGKKNKASYPITDEVIHTGGKQLGKRERDTLLKLVIGMAVRGYGYDPQAARNSATTEIAKDLEGLGMPIDSDTVKKWLNEAVDTVLPGDTQNPRKS